MNRDSMDTAASAFANKMIATGASASVIGGMTSTDIAAFGGLIIAVIGLVVQIYFKVKDDRRKEAIARKRYGVNDGN